MGQLMSEILNDMSDGRERRAMYTMFNKIFNNDSTTTHKAIVCGASATPISVAGAFTTGIEISADGTTGISITSGFSGTNMISLAGTGSTSGVLISGACANAISITGTNTIAGISISGDQVLGTLFHATAAATAAHSVTIPTGITLGAGLDINATSTGIVTSGLTMQGTGTFTTCITLSATAMTTGIKIGSGATTAIDIDCATDTTSAVTGSIHTDGGVGIAKALWVGTTSRLVGAVTMDGALTVGTTLGVTGIVTLTERLKVASAKSVIQGMNTFPLLTLTSLTSAAAVTYTAAQVVGGLISDIITEANAATLPAPADIVAAIPGCVVGSSFLCIIKNASAGAFAITVTASGLSTIVGTATIAQGNTKVFMAVVTNVTGAAEAVSFRSIGTLVH